MLRGLSAVALVAAITLTGCEGDTDQGDEGGRPDESSHAPGFAGFYRSIQLNDMAQAYDRNMIRAMYDQMCTLRRDDRAKILDNYESLTPHDIEEMDDVTTTMC